MTKANVVNFFIYRSSYFAQESLKYQNTSKKLQFKK